MTVLADHVTVAGRFARSANLERDAGRAEPLDGYVVTARALDAVDRIASVAADGLAGGAWSITGPYGAGKSSLALLLNAAFGPPSGTRETAWKLVDQVSPAVGKRIRQAHQRHRTLEAGFSCALVTANREPVNHTVLRALHAAVVCGYGKIPRSDRFPAAGTLTRALDETAGNDPRLSGPSSTALVEIARRLAEKAPLLLIIDEFGKNLEVVGDGRGTDPYLLQQLAEAGQGAGLPIFVLTLQHLAFEDHLIGADDPLRREWAKVQGRFEDISYVDTAPATRALIGTVFKVDDYSLRHRINCWAVRAAKEMRILGVADLADPTTLATCYPLHPLVAMVLPELCSRYGQHERTLFSFLAGSESATAAAFLKNTELPADADLPTVGLDVVYDYFVDSGVLAPTSAGRSSRWTEITTRIRDTHGLSTQQLRIVKAIALLNLISTAGNIRASSRVLALMDTEVGATLAALDEAGIVTYREFADEYRIWQGTDIDIRRLLESARHQVQRQSLADILSALERPAPVVAARHSAEYDVLRVFARRYVDGSERIAPLNPFSPYDGEVLLVVGSGGAPPSATWTPGTAKPVVAAISDDLGAVDRAAREAAAVSAVLKDPSVQDDRVARTELSERLAETKAAVKHEISVAFSVNPCRWVLLDASGNRDLTSGRGTAPLSAAADRAYPSTPQIRNEMLNRAELTSQGAMARRLLLEGMIERGSAPNLGFTGYGPEVAMYRAFLNKTKLHWEGDPRTKTMVFRKPEDPSLLHAWGVVKEAFRSARTSRINLNNVYASLLSPPIGMKPGVIPVFVTAALLAFNNEVAIYEHGTFKPLLTPEMSERMVRNPVHFEVKHFANTTGARRQVIDSLAKRFGVRPGFRKYRVANVLSIVGHLVSRMRHVENYTLHTSQLDRTTRRVRKALVTAVEPDKLLFYSLPKAVRCPSVPPSAKVYIYAESYTAKVKAAIDDLTQCYRRLLGKLRDFVFETCDETDRRSISGQAIAIEKEIFNPSVRPFILTLANDAFDTDIDWIEALATVVIGKAPAEWKDDDLRRFKHELPQQVAAFQRIVALHADYRASADGPFQALRLTLTRPDGTEYNRLVSVDKSHRDQVLSALDSTVEELALALGSKNVAERALVAALGDRLFSLHTNTEQASPEEAATVIDFAEREAQHG